MLSFMSEKKAGMSLNNKDLLELSRLEMLDAKTGNSYMKCGRVCRMWSGGRRRILGDEHGSQFYHVMSRTTGSKFGIGRKLAAKSTGMEMMVKVKHQRGKDENPPERPHKIYTLQGAVQPCDFGRDLAI